MTRYICIHGHFYQPPRENPWLEAIEPQDSAYPYHDWNQRITAECYGPNTAARILDAQNLITRIVNNYENVSFDFGPTLLAWMKDKAPEVYEAIQAADRESRRKFSGHGSALAQAYNHMILPLASRRDKVTQIRWGIADFEHRFGRRPEGMWLPETAVDLESLDILVDHGIRFTILSPHQAARVRRPAGRWRNTSEDRIDPTMAYLQQLPSGRSISLFFYDGFISRAVAFEGLLARGDDFAARLVGAFSDSRAWPQLVHIATDGETYGHHHRFGDMALAYALKYIEDRNLAKLTNYAEYLDRHPPHHVVEIAEGSSWSCAHGVERWRSDCGCRTGRDRGWNQAWRAPLREALDALRDELVPLFEIRSADLLKDPWEARDDYIHLILDRSLENVEAFFDRHAARALAEPEKITVLKLLELQRHAMLMYTSCGWFFDDLAGIETVQIIQYAGRALQLAEDLFGKQLEGRFLERLARAKSNLPERGDGRLIYESSVRPAVLNWEKVAAHYAVSTLFQSHPEKVRMFCYRFERQDSRGFAAGRARLTVGRAQVTSEVTRESVLMSYGAVHTGGHDVNGGVRRFQGPEAYENLVKDIVTSFNRADFAALIRTLDRHFGESTYSLKSLFRDEQRKVVSLILESALEDVESVYRQLHENYAPTMRFLTDLGIPSPKAFSTAAEFALNSRLRRAFEADDIDPQRIVSLLDAAQAEGVSLDAKILSFAWRKGIEGLGARFFDKPLELPFLERLESAAGLLRVLPFSADPWKVQNGYYRLLGSVYPDQKERAARGDDDARNWVRLFVSLGEKLSVKVG